MPCAVPLSGDSTNSHQWKRREFGAAAAWPLAARAQQRMRHIGVFTDGAADDPVLQERNAAFLQALQQLGWTVGRNLRIDYRWPGGDAERIRKYAAELVARRRWTSS